MCPSKLTDGQRKWHLYQAPCNITALALLCSCYYMSHCLWMLACMCVFIKVTLSWLLGAAGTVRSARMLCQRPCEVPGPGAQRLQLIPVKSHYTYSVSRVRWAQIWAAATWHVHAYGCGCWWSMCFGKWFQCEGGCFGTLHKTIQNKIWVWETEISL